MESQLAALEIAAAFDREFKGDTSSKKFALYVQDKLAATAKERYPDIFVDCILFGSKARGDFNEESDIDLCFVLNCEEEDIWEHYSHFLFDERFDLVEMYELNYRIDCSCITLGQYTNSNRPIIESIREEGISWTGRKK